MTDVDLGPWEPLSIAKASAIFSTVPLRWWVSGGHALEAHVNTSWRPHGDTDIGIVREDAPLLHKFLTGWDIHIAAVGVLTPWDGSDLCANSLQNNLWCRRDPSMPWCLDITIGDGNAAEWTFRRDPSICRPWNEAVLLTADGMPYLAPELQLLFKSKEVRPKDDLDAKVVIPLLEPTRRQALATLLPENHPWQELITRHRLRLQSGIDRGANRES